MQQTQININGKLYNSCFEKGELRSLAFFVCLSDLFTHKVFTSNDIDLIADKLGKSKQTVYRLIDKCRKLGLISYDCAKYALMANYSIHTKFGGKYTFSCYVNRNVLDNGFIAVYNFLRTIPIISNIRNQVKRIKKKQDLTYKMAQSQKDTYLSYKDAKAVNNAKKQGFDFKFNPSTTLSILKGSEIANISKPTFCFLKRELVKSNICNIKRIYETVLENISFDKYIHIMSKGEAIFESMNIPCYAKYDNVKQAIYIDKASEFVLLI